MAAKKVLLALTSAALIAACEPLPEAPIEAEIEAQLVGKLGLISVSEKSAKCALYPADTDDRALAYFLGNLDNGKGAMTIDGAPLEMFGVFFSDARSLTGWRLNSQNGQYEIEIELTPETEGGELSPQQSQDYSGTIKVLKPEGGDVVDIIGVCGE